MIKEGTKEYWDMLEKYRKWQELYVPHDKRYPVWSEPSKVPMPTPDTPEEIQKARYWNEGKSPEKLRNIRTRSAVKDLIDSQNGEYFKEPPSPYRRDRVMWDGEKYIETNIIPKFASRNYIPEFLSTSRPMLGTSLAAGISALQMGDQLYAASGGYGNSYWDKEYGASDPFSLRPIWDMALSDKRFNDTITNPEWVQRNPVAAAIYGGVTGGNEYSKAFIDAYIPDFLKQ